jgi:hypothetical protein
VLSNVLRLTQRNRSTSRMATMPLLIDVLHMRTSSAGMESRNVPVYVNHRRTLRLLLLLLLLLMLLLLLLLLLRLHVPHHVFEMGRVHLLRRSTLALLLHHMRVHLLPILLQVDVWLRWRHALGLCLCLQGLELLRMLMDDLVSNDGTG